MKCFSKSVIALCTGLALLTAGCGGGGSNDDVADDAAEAAAARAATRTLHGIWSFSSANDAQLLVFMPEGLFLMVDPIGDAGCGSAGIESGRYTWSASTTVLGTTFSEDTDGCAGLSGAGTVKAAAVSGVNSATFTADSAVLTGWRVPDGTATTPAIVGLWQVGSTRVSVAFLPDGTVLLEDRAASGGSCGAAGYERGSYTWSPTTGALTTAIAVDTNGCGGLSGSEGLSVQVADDRLSATILRADGTVEATLTRVTP